MFFHDRNFGRLAHEYAKFGISNWNYSKQRFISDRCSLYLLTLQFDIDYSVF